MFFVLAGIFVGMDLVALSIGMALENAFEDSTTATGILQAFLGGSFLFVSTVELIPGEMDKIRTHNLPLTPILICLLAGFSLMATLAKWV